MKSDILIIVTMNYNYSNKPPTFLQIGRKSVVHKIDTSSFFAMKFDDIQMSLAQVLPTKFDAVQVELERQRNNLTSKKL